jgi:hypothetical protein
MKTDMLILVKYLIVKSLHLKDGYINIKLSKNLTRKNRKSIYYKKNKFKFGKMRFRNIRQLYL